MSGTERLKKNLSEPQTPERVAENFAIAIGEYKLRREFEAEGLQKDMPHSLEELKEMFDEEMEKPKKDRDPEVIHGIGAAISIAAGIEAIIIGESEEIEDTVLELLEEKDIPLDEDTSVIVTTKQDIQALFPVEPPTYEDLTRLDIRPREVSDRLSEKRSRFKGPTKELTWLGIIARNEEGNYIYDRPYQIADSMIIDELKDDSYTRKLAQSHVSTQRKKLKEGMELARKKYNSRKMRTLVMSLRADMGEIKSEGLAEFYDQLADPEGDYADMPPVRFIEEELGRFDTVRKKSDAGGKETAVLTGEYGVKPSDLNYKTATILAGRVTHNDSAERLYREVIEDPDAKEKAEKKKTEAEVECEDYASLRGNTPLSLTPQETKEQYSLIRGTLDRLYAGPATGWGYIPAEKVLGREMTAFRFIRDEVAPAVRKTKKVEDKLRKKKIVDEIVFPEGQDFVLDKNTRMLESKDKEVK